jgi:hypothetical protein
MPITAPAVKVLPAQFLLTGAVANPGGVFQLGSVLYMPVTNPCTGNATQQGWADNVPPPLPCNARMLRSLDNGATWAEVDAAHAPGVSLNNTTTHFGFSSPLNAVLQNATTILVAYVKWDYHSADSPVLAFSIFHMDTNLWGAETSGGPAVTTAATVLQVAVRSGDGSVIIAYPGALESVAAVLYQRIFYTIYLAGWSAGAPIDATQTGSQLNYTLGGAVSGTSGRTHFFYAIANPATATSAVKHRTLTSANVLQAVVSVAVNQAGTTLYLPINFAGSIGTAYIRTTGFFSSAPSADVPVFTEQALPAGDLGPVFASGNGPLITTDNGGENAWGNHTLAAGGWGLGTFVFTPDPTLSHVAPDIGSPISLGSGIVVSDALVQENASDPQLYFFAFADAGGCPKNAQGV